MLTNTFIAELAPEATHADDDGLLVLYVDRDIGRAPTTLCDPAIVGAGVAAGEWKLMFVDAEVARAFYLRVDVAAEPVTDVDAAWYLENGD